MINMINMTPAAILSNATAYAASSPTANATDTALHWRRAVSVALAVTDRVAGDRGAIIRAADMFLATDADVAEVAAVATTATRGWRAGDAPSAAAYAVARRAVARAKVWRAAVHHRGGYAPLPSWSGLIAAELGFGPSAARLARYAARATDSAILEPAFVPLTQWATLGLRPGDETAAIVTVEGGSAEPLGRAFVGADGQWSIRPTGPAFGRLSPDMGSELLKTVRDVLR